MKRSFQFEDSGPKRELTAEIRRRVNRDKLDAALSACKYERQDAIEHLMRNAVMISDIVSFNGIPHIFMPREGVYRPFDYYELSTALYDSMRSLSIPDGFYGGITKIIKLCWAEVVSRKGILDNAIVVMKNGVFDTQDMCVHKFSAEYFSNMSVDYEYRDNEIPVRWHKFLDEVLPDKEMQDLLQEFIALAYVDRRYVKVEYMLTLLGPGSNGKSVVFEVVTSLLGEGNITNFSIRDLISSARSDQNLATINGKRMNYCSEIRTSEIGETNSDAFKALVSGEAMMARSLYKEPFRAYNIPVIMANANRLPALGDTSHALARRILIIPFEVIIRTEEQDKGLAADLRKELPGIFNWVMEGLTRLRKNRFQLSIPVKVKQLVASYFRDNCEILRWMDDVNYGLHKSADSDIPVVKTKTEWYLEYKEWAQGCGEKLMNRKAFVAQMNAQNAEQVRYSSGLNFKIWERQSEDILLARNLDLAIAMQRQELLDQIEEKIKAGEVLKVKGIEEVEMYLGLPPETIWPAFRDGALDGTFTVTNEGDPFFDVKAVQMALAKGGFYEVLDSGDKTVKRRASEALQSMRKMFNTKMRGMGVPIRKFSNQSKSIPIEDQECWVVADDWQYSKMAAAKVMAVDRDEYNKAWAIRRDRVSLQKQD